MSLHSPTQNQNVVRTSGPNSLTTLSFPQAYSGNPGGIQTGPPIRAFGGDDLGEFASLHLSRNFRRRARRTKNGWQIDPTQRAG